MSSWKRQHALTSAARAVLAVAAALFLAWAFATEDVIAAIAAAVIVAALIGLYLLRRQARAILVYNRETTTSNPDAPDTGPGETRNVTTPFGQLARRVWW